MYEIHTQLYGCTMIDRGYNTRKEADDAADRMVYWSWEVVPAGEKASWDMTPEEYEASRQKRANPA